MFYHTTFSLVFLFSVEAVLLGTGILEICSKFTGECACRSVISVKLLCNFIEIAPQHGCSPEKLLLQENMSLCNFIEIAPRHGCSPINLLHIFRRPFPRNTSVPRNTSDHLWLSPSFVRREVECNHNLQPEICKIIKTANNFLIILSLEININHNKSFYHWK